MRRTLPILGVTCFGLLTANLAIGETQAPPRRPGSKSSQQQQQPDDLQIQPGIPPGLVIPGPNAGGNNVVVHMTSVSSFSDGQHTFTTRNTNGDKHLTIKDRDGKQIFDGPINTPEQRKAIPADLAAKVPNADVQQNIRLNAPQNLPPEIQQNLQRQIQDLKKLNPELQNPQLLDPKLLKPGTVSSSTFSDGQHTLTTTVTNGSKHLHVTDHDGKQIFDGPIDTPEQLKAVPADVAAKIPKVNTAENIQLRVQRLQDEAHDRIAAGKAAANANANANSPAADVAASSFADEQHTMSLTTTNGSKHLNVKDHDGKQIFDGPIDTPEQIKALPADVAAKLPKLEAQPKLELHIAPDADEAHAQPPAAK